MSCQKNRNRRDNIATFSRQRNPRNRWRVRQYKDGDARTSRTASAPSANKLAWFYKGFRQSAHPEGVPNASLLRSVEWTYEREQKLSHWCHMDCFTNVFTTFLDLGTFLLCCRLWRNWELFDFIKNILILFWRWKKILRVWNDMRVMRVTLFILGWTNPLRNEFTPNLSKKFNKAFKTWHVACE